MNFSLKSSNKPPKKPQLKPSQSPTQKQFISEFDPSKPPLNPNPNTPTTIAPISNNWRTPNKLLDLPTKSDDPNLAFESSSSSLSVDPADATNLTYGLNVRKKGTRSNKSSTNVNNVDDGKVFTGKSGNAIDSIMMNKLRGDLDNLPEDRGFEEFDEMPVENFASALLKGYGWEQGMGLGKNKKDVKIVEIKPRGAKQGLGFVDDMPAPPSHDCGDRRDHRNEKKTKENGSVEKTKSSKRGRERYEREETSVGRGVNWLYSRIRVRVISKELKRGRLYLKKGEIVDVVGPTACDVAMDEGREIIQGVEQEALETALPRRGGPVLVLYGRYKGVFGSLQEKDMDRETAVVRHADTHELLTVKLEQIAEYVGDPDDIGY
nr:protein MOS2-like [Tanacetum cinerariifolium]